MSKDKVMDISGRERVKMLHINIPKTGQNIAHLMSKNGMAIKDVQRACGFSTPQAVYKWVHGMSLPAIDNLVILAYIFECQMDDIIIVEKENG